MKKLIVLFILLFAVPGFAEVYTANQKTFAWDSIEYTFTEPICDGTVYPCSKVGVHVYIRQAGKEPLLVSPETEADIYEPTQITISFSQEGEWAVGIASVRNRYSDADTLIATIINPVQNWSDEPNESNPEEFTVVFYEYAKTATGLRTAE